MNCFLVTTYRVMYVAGSNHTILWCIWKGIQFRVSREFYKHVLLKTEREMTLKHHRKLSVTMVIEYKHKMHGESYIPTDSLQADCKQ